MELKKLEHVLELEFPKEGDGILMIHQKGKPHNFSLYGEFKKFYKEGDKMTVELENYYNFDFCINPEEINESIHGVKREESVLEVCISNFNMNNAEIYFVG